MKTPFENINDASFFYYSIKHREALARMNYAVRQKKLGVLLIGEYGTGKTFLSRVLKKVFSDDRYIFVFITNPRLNPLEFIKEVHYQLGAKLDVVSPEKMDFLRSIQEGLEEYERKDMYVVIVVDEAQSIQRDDLLEEIRLLLNVQSEDSVLFTLVLLGQPQLEEKVEKIPQLRQRLSIRYKLSSLDKEEAREYIDYRLKVAGLSRSIFTDSAYDKIFSLSNGMPRAINNICDLALLSGFINKEKMIDKDIVDQVGEDLGDIKNTEGKGNMNDT